jgi:hypothetical protein
MPSGSTSPAGKVEVTPLARKDQRVNRVLVDASVAEQIDGVVRMEVEQTREESSRSPRRLISVRAVEWTIRQARANLEKNALADDQAGVRHQRVTHAVETTVRRSRRCRQVAGRRVRDARRRRRRRALR